jgi:hypothetical protein
MGETETESGDDDGDETTSTTITFNKRTEEFLKRQYPDAIGLSERIRMAIFDARQFRELGKEPRDEENR